jgi:hypothetical protein
VAADDLTLPPNGVLVHVGPYKTGTTALQTSLHAHRSELAAANVTYPGTHHRQMRPSWALVGRSRLGNPVVPIAEWVELVAECRAAAGRVMISSEDLSSASPGQVRTLVDDLGRDRVHVLFVVRRLDRLLASSWQERVKSVHEIRSYDDWLREVLLDPRSRAAEIFWGHQSVAGQVRLWTSALPPERLTLVVADEDDAALLLRLTERMLGLPGDTLSLAASANTSLSWNRAELVRGVNAGVQRGEWTPRLHKRLVYAGLVARLQESPTDGDDAPIPFVPQWATARIHDLSEQRRHEVSEAGVRVVGDPGRLRIPDDARTSGHGAPTTISVDSAVEGLTGVLDALQRRPGGRTGRPDRPAV